MYPVNFSLWRDTRPRVRQSTPASADLNRLRGNQFQLAFRLHHKPPQAKILFFSRQPLLKSPSPVWDEAKPAVPGPSRAKRRKRRLRILRRKSSRKSLTTHPFPHFRNSGNVEVPRPGVRNHDSRSRSGRYQSTSMSFRNTSTFTTFSRSRTPSLPTPHVHEAESRSRSRTFPRSPHEHVCRHVNFVGHCSRLSVKSGANRVSGLLVTVFFSFN